jgi:hypothetical protein
LASKASTRSQYVSLAFGRAAREAGISVSMRSRAARMTTPLPDADEVHAQ